MGRRECCGVAAAVRDVAGSRDDDDSEDSEDSADSEKNSA